MKTMQLLKIGLLFSAQVHYVDGAGMRARNMQQIVYTEQDEFEMNQHRSDTSTVKELHLQTVSDANAIGGSRRQLSFWSSFMNHVHCPLHPHDCDHHKKKSSGGSSHGNSGNSTGNSKNADGNGGGYNDNGSNVETGSNNDNDGGNSGNENDYSGNNNNGDNGNSGNNDNGTSGNSYYVTNGYYNGNNNNGNSGNNNNGNSGNNDNGNNGNNDNDGNSTQFYISNDGEYDTRNSSSLGSEMMYGAMSLGGIAVLASLISRSRRRNINMDDHLLNGAVDKRKNTFAGLFKNKPNNSASELSTNYVAA